MIHTNRKGVNYAENLIDSYLTFENSQTWTVSSGTGSGVNSNEQSFYGIKSLKIQNTAPTTDLVVTNAIQNTVITNKTVDAQLSFYVYKDSASDEFSGNVKIFKNAVLLDTQTWTLEDSQDEKWYRFVSDQIYSLNTLDVITFTFQFDGDAGFVGAKTIYIDGLMLNPTERLDFAPPIYTHPLDTLQTITDRAATTTNDLELADVDVDALTLDSLQFNALSTAPSSASDTGTLGEIRVDEDYIYVCTATDTWKRVAIATW